MSFEQIQLLNPKLHRIDEMRAEITELKQLRPDAYARLTESWAVESTYNSNTIEGSMLSLGDTALVREGVAVDAPMVDIRQAEGGFAALKFLEEELEGQARLSEGLIKRIHELTFAEAEDPAVRGAYRVLEVEITGTTFEPASTAYVLERMAGLVGSINRSRSHAVITSALFHIESESIHPFVNANGRTGRLISNFILMRAGYEHVNIQAESRSRYVNAIKSFQLDDDPYPFVRFFCDAPLDRQAWVLALLSVGAKTEGESWRESAVDRYIEGEAGVDPVSVPVGRLIDALGDRELSSSELITALGLSRRTHFRRAYLIPALAAGLIERTLPSMPHSPKQKYRRAR